MCIHNNINVLLETRMMCTHNCIYSNPWWAHTLLTQQERKEKKTSWKSRECWMRFKSLSRPHSISWSWNAVCQQQHLPFWCPKSNMLDLICIQITGRAVILSRSPRQWSHCELGSVWMLCTCLVRVCTVSRAGPQPSATRKMQTALLDFSVLMHSWRLELISGNISDCMHHKRRFRFTELLSVMLLCWSQKDHQIPSRNYLQCLHNYLNNNNKKNQYCLL